MLHTSLPFFLCIHETQQILKRWGRADHPAGGDSHVSTSIAMGNVVRGHPPLSPTRLSTMLVAVSFFFMAVVLLLFALVFCTTCGDNGGTPKKTARVSNSLFSPSLSENHASDPRKQGQKEKSQRPRFSVRFYGRRCRACGRRDKGSEDRASLIRPRHHPGFTKSFFLSLHANPMLCLLHRVCHNLRLSQLAFCSQKSSFL